MNNTMDGDSDQGHLTKEYLAGLIVGIVVTAVTLWLGIDFILFHRERAKAKERKTYQFYKCAHKARVTMPHMTGSDVNVEDVTNEPKINNSTAKGKINKLMKFFKIKRSDDTEDKTPQMKIRRSESVGMPMKNENTSDKKEANQNGTDITSHSINIAKSSLSIPRRNTVGHSDAQPDKRFNLPPIQMDIIRESVDRESELSLNSDRDHLNPELSNDAANERNTNATFDIVMIPDELKSHQNNSSNRTNSSHSVTSSNRT